MSLVLHYGTAQFPVDDASRQQLVDELSTNLDRTRWISFVKGGGEKISVLVTAGFPIWTVTDDRKYGAYGPVETESGSAEK